MKKIEASNKIYVAPSKIARAGRGVFARKSIKKGEVIETCPVIVLTGTDVSPVKRTKFKNYYFIWHQPKKIATRLAICLGFGSLYNHSYTPNATYKKLFKDNVISFIAIRDISKGEEITVNYNYGDPKNKSRLWIKSIKPA